MDWELFLLWCVDHITCDLCGREGGRHRPEVFGKFVCESDIGITTAILSAPPEEE